LTESHKSVVYLVLHFVVCLHFSDVLNSKLEVLAKFLSTPLASGLEEGNVGWPYVAFDLNPSVVKVNIIYAQCLSILLS
jgi:hypothetical protein